MLLGFVFLFVIWVVEGGRILQSNDDGWAELYLRSLHEELESTGHDVVLSAPADNQSGTGSSDKQPLPRTEPCQYDSCLANSGPMGTNISNPRLNWVNSYPVTSVKFGLDVFGRAIWLGGVPDLVVSGPNVGQNLWLSVPFSGTVGAAVFAAHEARIPSIAFSGMSGGNLPWNADPVPLRSRVYAQLAAKLIDTLLNSSQPYLPQDVWLNVNFPRVEGPCTSPEAFKWILTRIEPGTFSRSDVKHCGHLRLPTETRIVYSGGCRISVSVGDAGNKMTAPADKQAEVLEKLQHLFTCP